MHSVPWQQAVYTRPTNRDKFQFSHARHTTVTKEFLPSLRLDSLRDVQRIRRSNVETFKSRPVLVLVTGDWAQNISLDSYARVNGDIHKIPTEPYDHFERLGCEAKKAESPEVSKSYRLLEYHCSVSTYTPGEDHGWTLEGVVPMLSDMLIIPRVLQQHRLACIMGMFSRSLKKTLTDSLLMAGGKRYKEDTWALKTSQI